VWEGGGEGGEPIQDPDILAGRRCSLAVLDFLSSTDVGRLVPAEEDTGSGVSERERRERRERGEERRAGAAELGARGGGGLPLSSHALFHGIRRRGVGDWRAFFCPLFCAFICSFLCDYIGA